MSSLEVIFAATLQLQRPTNSKSSATGKFSSRLVTAILSGTPEGGIDVSAYQASEQACAMVDADMIEASVDPGIVRVKEEEDGRYIPDVFFRFKNEYGIDVKQSAKPCFPVEYLLVNVTHGFPTSPSPAFVSSSPFSIENRPGIEIQDTMQVFSALVRLKAGEIIPGQSTGPARTELVRYLSDWHLLTFLGSTGFLSERELGKLAQAVTFPKLEDPNVLDDVLKSDGWKTLITIAEESAPRRPSKPPPQPPTGTSQTADIPPEMFDDIDIPPDTGAATKTCTFCTFAENPASAVDCEVCGLPLSS